MIAILILIFLAHGLNEPLPNKSMSSITAMKFKKFLCLVGLIYQNSSFGLIE